MTNLVRIGGDFEVGLPGTLADGSSFVVPATALVDSTGAAVGPTNPLQFTQTIQSASTDRSGTITLGGTQQQLMPINLARRGLWVQNQSTGDLYINGLGNAAIGQPSMLIAAGQLYETPATHVSTAAVSIIGATTGQAFAAREW